MTDHTPDSEPHRTHPSESAPRASAVQSARRDTIAARAQKVGGSRGRTVGWRNRDVVRATALVLAVLLAVKLFWIAHVLFFAVFLGMLFAIAVSSGVDHLQRFRIPRAVAAAIIVLSFVSLLVGVGAWVAPTLRAQGTELRQKLPEAIDRVQEWVKKRESGVLGLLVTEGDDAGTSPAGGARPAGRPAMPGGAPPTTDTAATTNAPALQNQMRDRVSGLSRYLFPFIASTVEIVGGILLILFLSIYFAAEPELYRRGLLSLLPARKRPRGVVMMDRIAVVLRKWLLTQLVAMSVMCVASTIVLLLLHVKAAFALGVLVGLFEFIPTIGPILSAMPGIAMGFLDSPEKAGYVALAY